MIAAAVALAGGRTLLPFDSPLEARGEQEFERLYQTRLSEHQLEVARRQTARQQKYDAYLQTDAWRAKEARVIAATMASARAVSNMRRPRSIT